MKGTRRDRGAALRVRPLAPDDWPIVLRLFGDKGACGGCWCMLWRLEGGGRPWEEVKGAKNRGALRRLIEQGRVHAVVAFAGGEPVGWCSFGPRSSFPRVGRSRVLRRASPEGAWSIVCFFIPAPWRGQGVATLLLQAATERTFALGACEVEGYPVKPKDSPERVPAAFASTGVPALFREAGYEELERPPSYYRLWIRRAPASAAASPRAAAPPRRS
jgi:GNAT superfamily N-acetyltransferase